MSLVNKTNSQFIQPRIDNRKGVVCGGQNGGGYGATAESLAASATSGLGKGYVTPSVHYNSCNKQSGGGHNYDADVEGFSYGYTKEGAGIAGQLRGSYAPISVNKKTNMCGGKKRRRKSKKKRKRRRKNKSRKSRKRRKSRRRRKRRGGLDIARELKEAYNSRDRYSSDPEYAMKYPAGLTNSAMKIARLEGEIRETHGENKLKQIKESYKKSVCDSEAGTYTNYGVINCAKKGGRRKRRKSRRGKRRTKRGGSCSKFKRLTRKQRGGKYQQFGSNIPNTPSYSTPLASSLPWATGPGSFARQINCTDNYNHFKK